MFTSIIALAVANTLALKPEALPSWDRDYGHAKAIASKEQKPMAVVVGTGAAGWDKLVSDGTVFSATSAELRAAYVWVYLDLDQETGKKLASNFEFTKGPALVLSDRGGSLQAYRRVGAVNGDEFRKVLGNYAETDRVVNRTEETGEIAPRPVANPWDNSCPSCRRY